MLHRGASITNTGPNCWRVRVEYINGNFETTAKTFDRAFSELSRCIAEDRLEYDHDYQDLKEELCQN
jgi:hypothetical protein